MPSPLGRTSQTTRSTRRRWPERAVWSCMASTRWSAMSTCPHGTLRRSLRIESGVCGGVGHGRAVSGGSSSGVSSHERSHRADSIRDDMTSQRDLSSSRGDLTEGWCRHGRRWPISRGRAEHCGIDVARSRAPSPARTGAEDTQGIPAGGGSGRQLVADGLARRRARHTASCSGPSG